MFTFKKLVTPFLLPPGVLIVLLFLGAVWLVRRKNRGGAFFAVSFALLLWILSISPVANVLVSGYEDGLSIPKPLHGDVIVLLGGGLCEDVVDLTGKGSPSDESVSRIVTAVRAQRLLHVPVIVSAGAVFPGRTPEAHVIGRFLADLGVSKNMIILEDKSRDTAENGKFTAEICRRHKFENPVLVTSALHMKRAQSVFSAQKIKVLPLPCSLQSKARIARKWFDFLPSANALERTSYVAHEYLGLLYYRLTH